MKQPLASSPSVARSPPQATLAPSFLPISMYSRIFFTWFSLIWEPIWVSFSQGIPTFTALNRLAASSTNLS